MVYLQKYLYPNAHVLTHLPSFLQAIGILFIKQC